MMLKEIDMDIAQILKFATLTYLICVGIWFSTAQAKFSRESKARPTLFLMVALSLITSVATLIITINRALPYPRLIATLIMTTAAVILIKSAFRAIKKRNLGLAFSGIVPDQVVQHGPYRYIRHPLYLAYSIFWASCTVISASVLVGIFAILVISLYVMAAKSEERDLLNSDLAPAYSSYRQRTGLILPRFFK